MKNERPEKCELRTCSCLEKQSNKKVKSQDDAECDWWINSPQYNNCFWTYVKAKSGPDGSMNELVQAEIAKLMGWSNTKTHFELKQATKDLIEALNKHKAKELIHEDPEILVDLPDVSLISESE